MEKTIIELTPFLFEDGQNYYFKVMKKEYSNHYHTIYLYRKEITEKKDFWGRKTKTKKLEQMSEDMVSVEMNTNDVKSTLRRMILATKAHSVLKNWDGLVGNIPDGVKTSLKRDGTLKTILGE